MMISITIIIIIILSVMMVIIIMIMITVMKHFLKFSHVFLVYFKETN